MQIGGWLSRKKGAGEARHRRIRLRPLESDLMTLASPYVLWIGFTSTAIRFLSCKWQLCFSGEYGTLETWGEPALTSNCRGFHSLYLQFNFTSRRFKDSSDGEYLSVGARAHLHRLDGRWAALLPGLRESQAHVYEVLRCAVPKILGFATSGEPILPATAASNDPDVIRREKRN